MAVKFNFGSNEMTNQEFKNYKSENTNEEYDLKKNLTCGLYYNSVTIVTTLVILIS